METYWLIISSLLTIVVLVLALEWIAWRAAREASGHDDPKLCQRLLRELGKQLEISEQLLVELARRYEQVDVSDTTSTQALRQDVAHLAEVLDRLSRTLEGNDVPASSE